MASSPQNQGREWCSLLRSTAARKLAKLKPEQYRSSPSLPWYNEGLHFSCQRCGRCCSGPPGIVQCTRAEAQAIAQALKISWDDFLRYVGFAYKGGYFLREVKTSFGFDCILLQRPSDHKNAEAPSGCRVHMARPLQCRTWPFWPEVVYSPTAWRLAGKRCPGIGQGEPHPWEEIRTKLAQTPDPWAFPPEELSLGQPLPF